MSSLASEATWLMRCGGPTRIGRTSFSFAASIALSSETSLQGWATARLTGGACCARSTSWWNFSCRRPSTGAGTSSMGDLRLRASRLGLEQLVDAREPAAALLGQPVARVDHLMKRLQRHARFLGLVGDQLGNGRDRPL